MIKSLRQEDCKLLLKDENDNWYEFADLSNCSPLNNQTYGDDGNTKRCNIASYFADVYLKDGLNKCIQARIDTANQLDFFGALAGALSIVTAPFGGSLLVVSTAAAIGASIQSIASALVEADINAVNSETTAEFWLDVKRKLYCAMPANGKITRNELYVFANEVAQIPNKPNLMPVFTEMIRGLELDVAIKAAQIGALIEGNMSECESMNSCASPCDLSLSSNPLSGESVTQVVGTTDRWILTSSNVQSAGSEYVISVETPLSSHQCQVQSVEVTSGDVSEGSTYEASLLNPVRASWLFKSFDELIGRCFTRLTFRSDQQFTVEVTLAGCGSALPPSAVGCALHLEENGVSPLPAGTYGSYDNVYLLFDGQKPANAEGWREYYLGDANACCHLMQLPLSTAGEVPPPNPPEYGVAPTEIEYKPCGGDWTPISALPKEGDPALEFNAIRFKGNYAIQVTLEELCVDITDQFSPLQTNRGNLIGDEWQAEYYLDGANNYRGVDISFTPNAGEYDGHQYLKFTYDLTKGSSSNVTMYQVRYGATVLEAKTFSNLVDGTYTEVYDLGTPDPQENIRILVRCARNTNNGDVTVRDINFCTSA